MKMKMNNYRLTPVVIHCEASDDAANGLRLRHFRPG
jgi:hypothetical protein